MKPEDTQPLGSATGEPSTRHAMASTYSERVRQEEVERALGRLRHLSDDDRAAVDALTRSLLDKLLHAPTGSSAESYPGRPTTMRFDLEVRDTGESIVVERKAPGAEAPNLRSSIVTRAQIWLEGSLDRMSDEEVLKLVEAQSPSETIAELLAATPEIQRARDSDWSELLLRGADAKSRISALAGGLLSPSEAARLLKISVPGVKQRLERKKLLAVPLPGGQRGFPGLQFREDGRVREGVAEVAAAGANLDPWALLAILVDEVEDEAGGTLLERLNEDAVRADVLGRLAGYGEHGAA